MGSNKMTERFVWSDPHLGHSNILTFFDYNGKRVRDFSSIEEMNEILIENHNKIINKNDVVYWCGDIVINKKYLPLLERFKGSKRLILGNHDPFENEYPKYFEKVYAMRIFPKQAILTHIPIHPDCIERFKVNICGHIHTNNINNIHYMNVCVDNKGDNSPYIGMNYTPRNLDEILDDPSKFLKTNNC
jgi:calcineurin-like phosphoesterase family protein